MKKLLASENVFIGQVLYGYKPTDYTFTSRGLTHPVSIFMADKFERKMSRVAFVQDALLNVSNTAFRQRKSGELYGNYRTYCLYSWVDRVKGACLERNEYIKSAVSHGGKTKRRYKRKTRR